MEVNLSTITVQFDKMRVKVQMEEEVQHISQGASVLFCTGCTSSAATNHVLARYHMTLRIK